MQLILSALPENATNNNTASDCKHVCQPVTDILDINCDGSQQILTIIFMLMSHDVTHFLTKKVSKFRNKLNWIIKTEGLSSKSNTIHIIFSQ